VAELSVTAAARRGSKRGSKEVGTVMRVDHHSIAGIVWVSKGSKLVSLVLGEVVWLCAVVVGIVLKASIVCWSCCSVERLGIKAGDAVIVGIVAG
jgi:hypothetical protein